MRISFFLLFTFLVSCQGVEPRMSDEYFDVAGLIDKQYDLLKIRGASLSKTAIIGTDTSQVSITPDTSQWKNELGIFERIDINKPKWRGQYTVSDEDDQFSNLTIRTFSTTNEEAEVKYLKLYYLSEVSDLRKLEAQWHENNPIYKSQRTLTLHFEDINKQVVLNGYEVTGGQKMILQDKVNFAIEATIGYP